MAIYNKRMGLVCAGLAVYNVLVAAITQAQDVSFEDAQNFGAGIGPVSVAVGDFNGDGRLDLAVANVNSDNLSVLLGNGDGTFPAARDFAAGRFPGFVTVGDFDGDGVEDLAVANGGSDEVSVFLSNGDGSFQEARNFAAGNRPESIAVGTSMATAV